MECKCNEPRLWVRDQLIAEKMVKVSTCLICGAFNVTEPEQRPDPEELINDADQEI